MKAIINLTTIAELPCVVSCKLSTMTSFTISKEMATADTLNALASLEATLTQMIGGDISVHVRNELIESLVFVD